MVCEVNKIDSNGTGLRVAEEECIGVLRIVGSALPTPIWYPQEPNSYSETGGKITTVKRNPINPSRQEKKGTVTDLSSSGGWVCDLTPSAITRLMQGICFADARQKVALQPLNGVQNTAASVTSATSTIAVSGGGAGFAANRLIATSGFGLDSNNGLKTVASSTGGTIVTVEALVDEAAPPANANVEVVGHQFAAGDLSLALAGTQVTLATVAEDFTTFGLIAGEWVFIGGDATGTQFASGVGMARIGSIAVDGKSVVLDKVSWPAPAADAGAGKTVRLFFGTLIRNEEDPALIVRRSYQLERTLGKDADGVQSEYIVGAVASEFTLNVKQADKVTMDFMYMGIDYEPRSGATGLKAGVRPELPTEDCFNTSSDFSRINMSLVVPGNPSPVPLFAYSTDLKLSIKNNVTPNKAIGTLGAFDMSAGTFAVSGSSTVYFATVEAAQAVRNNADVTLDIVMVKKNVGILFDIPLLTLGNGLANVTQDQPIMLALDQMAAESTFGNTLTFMHFPYLPNIAE